MANILIIDDEEAMRFMMAEFAVVAGHSVTTSSNGRDVRKHLTKKQFDLVVTDMIMPEFDGVEVIQVIKQLILPPKIIAVSGGGMAHAHTYLDLAKKLGAVDVLSKPFSARDFIEAIRAALV